MENAIEFKNVIKDFGEARILNDLSIDIAKGKITTILGFSGAGKSTMLKHILGLLKPTSGEVNVLGKNLSQLDDFEMREFRQNFGMLFQYAALFDSMSAFDNIAFPLKEFTKMGKAEIQDRVEKLFDSVGLDPDSMYRLPSELSGGMRKRVGLARALALEPQVMLYDEPTTGLDPITTKMVNDLIKSTSVKNAERQMTSVIISHDIEATLKISDYVAFLKKGHVVEYGTVEEFQKSEHPEVRSFLEL